MSSRISPSDTRVEPTCAGCGESIPVGVARYPTPDGFMHDVCHGIVAGPPGVLGAVDEGDRLQVKVRGKWLAGTVEHAGGLETGDYVVRVALDTVIPDGVTDHVDVCTTCLGSDIHGPIWTHPEGFDIIPGWDTFDSDREPVLPTKYRSVGDVKIRGPTR